MLKTSLMPFQNRRLRLTSQEQLQKLLKDGFRRSFSKHRTTIAGHPLYGYQNGNHLQLPTQCNELQTVVHSQFMGYKLHKYKPANNLKMFGNAKIRANRSTKSQFKLLNPALQRQNLDTNGSKRLHKHPNQVRLIHRSQGLQRRIPLQDK